MLIFLINFIVIIKGVDRTKFKKCEESHFCKRNRNLVKENPLLYNINSFEKEQFWKYSGLLQSPHLPKNDKRLTVELTTIKSNIIRLRVIIIINYKMIILLIIR